ncbi:Lon protease [Pseudidiomarina piscicola]|uniref:endopeptidase La n=1 Tax=Pseudidiomarina piscicola TaxID=2614830 RepID=A0A6S6WTJ8_9GAMM|nr:Lon protease family protein [Pseudidiomarina piscicola]CAB0149960.1 Lon protease [Pseudidiomarina piscicola]VZT39406.1 Lon protease [Pseudomonas aeruginosa]
MRVAAEQLQPKVHEWAQKRPVSTQANPLVGQDRALAAIKQTMRIGGRYAHGYVVTTPGLRIVDVLQELQARHQWVHFERFDWLYLANPDSANEPLCVNVPAGSARTALQGLMELFELQLSERETKLEELRTTYPNERFLTYIERIKDKSFADLPGNELAMVIVESAAQQDDFVLCDRVTETSLFGSIRLQSVGGTISSELHLIQPGALLKANGGVLAIDAEELLTQPGLWRKLKYVLRTSQFHWPQPGEANIAAYYQPEPVPIHLKVLLLGERSIYAQLRELDSDFDNLFPYLADFSAHYPLSQFAIEPYFNYLAYVEREAATLPLAPSAIPLVLKYASRLSDYQTELSLDTIALMQLLREAAALAEEQQLAQIEHDTILAVLQQRLQRDGYIAELSRRQILEGQVYIETSGSVIGQVNGLTVVTIGGTEFGEPARITATVHYGDGDIIDIDRKSELSGSIHTKGVMILSAYIANVFARSEEMSLSATIVFEQSYYEVDGDSASLAELCCLLSALAEAPIAQGLAITGAVDQFGRVQAIGAVNEKIEGHFALCKERGLNGQQGVIIPSANLSQLNLEPDVIAAVAEGNYHVYAIDDVAEALALLSGDNQEQLYARIEKRLDQLQHCEPQQPWYRRIW